MSGRDLDDETPLDGSRIDVAVRVGWLMRMARLGAGGTPPVGLGALAERLGTNTTRLHRAETGRLHSGVLLNGYEDAIGLPPESLRAPVDVLCRGFAYAPADREPGPVVATVPELSALTERLGRPGATGAQWLSWARALARPGAIGLPEELGLARVRRLFSEMGRAVGSGYPARYQALALLRDSAYGHLVLAGAQELTADPHVQVLYDAMSAVGEAVTPEAVDWCFELLAGDRPRLVVGAALALENMAEVSGDPDFWTDLVPRLIYLLEEHDDGDPQHEWLSHLLRLVPPEVLRRAGRVPATALAPTADIPDWSRTQLNRHWTDCQARALAITDALGLPEQPVLARLLFDIAIGPHESRAVTGYMLVAALPALRGLVGEHVAALAEGHADPVIRDRASRRLTGVLGGDPCDLAGPWLRSTVTADLERGCHVAGEAGCRLPDVLLRELVAGPVWQPALYAAGMAGHPLLSSLAGDQRLPDEVRGAAAWWLGEGSRIVE